LTTCGIAIQTTGLAHGGPHLVLLKLADERFDSCRVGALIVGSRDGVVRDQVHVQLHP